MPRTAKLHTHYRPTDYPNGKGPGPDFAEYVVETRQGSASWSTGRVLRAGRTWMALGVGAKAWTDRHPTRAAAVADMHAHRTWLDTPQPTHRPRRRPTMTAIAPAPRLRIHTAAGTTVPYTYEDVALHAADRHAADTGQPVAVERWDTTRQAWVLVDLAGGPQ